MNDPIVDKLKAKAEKRKADTDKAKANVKEKVADVRIWVDEKVEKVKEQI